MSVPDIIKTALPLAQGEASGNNANPAKMTPGSVVNIRPSKVQLATIAAPTATTTEKTDGAPPTPIKGKTPPKPPEEFFKDLQQFHERRGTPIMQMLKISGRVVDLHCLYSEVTERGGFLKVNNRDEWEEVLPALGLRDKCVNATAAVKHIYRRCLEKYERLNFFGEDPDKMEALEANEAVELGGRSRVRYPSTMHSMGGSSLTAIPMSYNYRQHVVNMDRRRTYQMSMDLHKTSQYEKLMLSLMSPLPNEQDFAINVCTLMTNESKHTLKLNEYPKLLDVLLAHAGVFRDYSLRQLFQHVYTDVRHHSLYGFWRDLLHDKPQVLELYTDEQKSDAMLIDDLDEVESAKQSALMDECLSMDFLNLGRGEGTQDYIGQRVQQIVSVLRNLSFFDENLQVFAKNRTFLRFIVMSVNIRWGNIHNQALDIAGNVAAELDLFDPTTDELTRNLMSTLCEGVEGMDRAVIINSLEILNKLCQKDSNEEHIFKCLDLKFYQTLCLFLSLNDIMLLIFTLEAIYALTSMGARSCHLIMQVRGVIDQLVSLVTVEAQTYGPDGCILMRVVETVPGNMLPMVAQNIANLQNVAVIQKQQQIQQSATTVIQQQQLPQQLQLPQHDPQVAHTDTAQPSSQAQSTQPPQALALAPAQQPLQMAQNYTHEDEQYALAWLGATFERAASTDSHVEQQELYRMYLCHCQKSGKHSVVNHLQFPRLVRLIFNNSVGPVIVRRSDGTELAGFHYVSIRVRAQPLPIQSKSSVTPQKTADGKLIKGELGSGRKLKKKPKLQQEPLQPQPSTESINAVCKPESLTLPMASNVSVQANDQTKATNPNENIKTEMTNTMTIAAQLPTVASEAEQSSNVGGDSKAIKPEDTAKPATLIQQPVQPIQQSQQPQPTIVTTETVTPGGPSNQPLQQQQPSSSLIKSLLANKVNQRQQKQKELTASSAIQTTTHTNVMATITTATQQQQPIKVASTAISALVNNPLMQSTPLKVGQTTIKPLVNPQAAMEKKQIIESAPPPLAPLSGANMAKDASGRPVIIANQMLVEILDKKTADPPIPATIVKRKLDDSTTNIGTDSAKRMTFEATAHNATKDDSQAVTPSKNAANLYAEMAASILEDEDLEDIPTFSIQTQGQQMQTSDQMQQQQQQQQPQQQLIIPAKIQQTSMQNVQRQLMFQTNQPPQLKLTQSPGGQQVPTAMATIKTDQGLQTVPVILQQKPMDQNHPQIIQQVIQNAPQPQQQTQYVLATNPQGQTYLVAQQSQMPQQQPQQQSTQTVLVTQTPQQQSAGTKTIIILQQQPHQQQQQQIIHTGGGTQKMIMTTPQGQQVYVTQRQQPTMVNQTQPQFFINPQTGAVQQVPVSSVQTTTSLQMQNANNMLQRQLIQSPAMTHQHQQLQQQQTGQISPSLLSQLNHIPATIKLHQPQMAMQQQQPHQHQQATISRLGKSVSIVQTTPAAPPIQIPQLQQHQSIIQQHIISGPADKCQVILGGRAIEIKETVITQTQPPPQQSQLNSQTIITTQPPQQMQQQQIRAVIEQQHPSIIQQKITVPLPTQATQQAQAVLGQKAPEPSSLIQNRPITPAQNVGQTAVLAQATIAAIKKTTPIAIKPQPCIQAPIAPTKPSISTGPPPLAAVATNAITAAGATTSDDTGNTVSSSATITAVATPTTTAPISSTTSTIISQPPLQQQLPPQLPAVDPNWLYVCDWRNCPRRKFKSFNDLQHHAYAVHCPDHLEPGAEIFCQWGIGPGLCDGVPRKRYSLMTHIADRHLTNDSLRQTMQRRIATGANNIQPTQPPVTIVRNVDQAQRGSTASPALSTSSSSSLPSTGSSALHAIKRHNADFVNAKELMDENEGPVTKSIRLTAALILRNLVTYTTTAKRSLRRYEPHLANVALSNVESSGAISHILFELNN